MKSEKKRMVLANGEKFVNFKEFNDNGTKYIFAVGINEEETDLNDVYCVFKEIIKDGKKYMEEVEDPNIISKFKIDESDFE